MVSVPAGLAEGRRTVPTGEQVSLTKLPYCLPQGDVPLQPSARVSMSEKNGMQVLEIHEVTQDDLGVYTCLVVNGSGKASMSAELSIQGTGCQGEPGHMFPSRRLYPPRSSLCTMHYTSVCYPCHMYIPMRPWRQGLNRKEGNGGGAALTWPRRKMRPHPLPHTCVFHLSFLLRVLF